MYKFPIVGNLTVIQSFTDSHNGVDVVCGTPEETWGKECIWPFPWPGVVYESQVDSLFGATQHAHAQIDTTDPTTGIKYSLLYLHLSAVTKQKTVEDNQIIVYQQGEVIGKIGNNGSVTPKPTPEQPYNGSHLHLGLGVKNPGDLNHSMVDPLLYFNLGFKFNKNLYFGLQDPDVLKLQERLNIYPTYVGFGPKTLLAVIKYQKAHGISTTGFVGELTRASLNA